MPEHAEVTEFYEWFGNLYVHAYGWRPDSLITRWERLARVLRESGVRTVLDVACGVGRDSLELARNGFDVTGLDISEKMLSIGQAKAKAEKLAVRFVVGDMCELPAPFGEAAFDCVMCVGNSLLHLNTKSEIASSIRRMAFVLKPGGLLLLQCQTVDNSIREQGRADVQVLRVNRDAASLVETPVARL